MNGTHGYQPPFNSGAPIHALSQCFDSLPPHTKRYFDPNGRPYLHNSLTGQVMWDLQSPSDQLHTFPSDHSLQPHYSSNHHGPTQTPYSLQYPSAFNSADNYTNFSLYHSGTSQPQYPHTVHAQPHSSVHHGPTASTALTHVVPPISTAVPIPSPAPSLPQTLTSASACAPTSTFAHAPAVSAAPSTPIYIPVIVHPVSPSDAPATPAAHAAHAAPTAPAAPTAHAAHAAPAAPAAPTASVHTLTLVQTPASAIPSSANVPLPIVSSTSVPATEANLASHVTTAVTLAAASSSSQNLVSGSGIASTLVSTPAPPVPPPGYPKPPPRPNPVPTHETLNHVIPAASDKPQHPQVNCLQSEASSSLSPDDHLCPTLSQLSDAQAAYALAPEDITTSCAQLEIKAENLKKRDIIGTSDPICWLQIPAQRTLNVGPATIWKTIGKTEILRNTTNPHWSNRFRIPYLFEQRQPLKFILVDVDNFKTTRGNFLGSCQIHLADIVREGSCSIPLTNSKGKGKFGTLTIRAHGESDEGQVRVKMSLIGQSLSNVELIGRSDPFFRIDCNLPGDQAPINLATSEYIKNNLNPAWRPQKIIVPTNGSPWDQVKLTISVFDWNRTSAHRKIGDTSLTLNQLTGPLTLDLKNQRRGRQKRTGQISVRDVNAQEMPSFLAYVQGGLRLKFVVAVDFTSSNRPVTDVNSLHYMGDGTSIYHQALSSVGSVISAYIRDGSITALGFGAKLPGETKASFEFSLSGSNDPRVNGVNGLLKAYLHATRNVRLSGPTNFAPFIRSTTTHCREDPVSQDNQNFTVLLILTDGIISDIDETIEAIIDASYDSPLSIVIVGVGNEDFSAMKRLDADDKPLRSVDSKREAKHDIVQFTKFDSSTPLDALAADVLHEIPQRVVEFMMDCGIHPGQKTVPV